MKRKHEIQEARSDIKKAIKMAEEMIEQIRVFKQVLETVLDDEEIPLEVRRQYERLLIQQLVRGNVF